MMTEAIHHFMRPTVRAVKRLPPDAAHVLVVAASMPVLMLIYQIMPTQNLGRGLFAVSVAALAWLVGDLLNDDHSVWRDIIQALAIGLGVATITTLILLLMVDADEQLVTFVWRGQAALQQAWVVVAWLAASRLHHRWLSRTAAKGALFFAGCGLIWFLYVNFQLPDPATWETWPEMARGVGARTFSPAVEPLLAAGVWGWVLICAMRWLFRHPPDEHGS